MQRQRRSHRPVFVIICLSILAMVAVASLLIWHVRTQPPTPPLATCGTVIFPQVISPQQNIPQVEHCFSRAYQQCAATTMRVTENGTDVGTTTVYWPHQQGNTCQIIAQSTSSGPNASGSTETETCQSVLSQNGGLLFQRCSTSGDVFISG